MFQFILKRRELNIFISLLFLKHAFIQVTLSDTPNPASLSNLHYTQPLSAHSMSSVLKALRFITFKKNDFFFKFKDL